MCIRDRSYSASVPVGAACQMMPLDATRETWHRMRFDATRETDRQTHTHRERDTHTAGMHASRLGGMHAYTKRLACMHTACPSQAKNLASTGVACSLRRSLSAASKGSSREPEAAAGPRNTPRRPHSTPRNSPKRACRGSASSGGIWRFSVWPNAPARSRLPGSPQVRMLKPLGKKLEKDKAYTGTAPAPRSATHTNPKP